MLDGRRLVVGRGRPESGPRRSPTPCTAELLTKHGIFNHENLIFDALLADRKYQFMYVFVPVPIKGATGSPGCPIAMT